MSPNDNIYSLPDCLKPEWISPAIGSIAPTINDLLYIKGEPYDIGTPLPSNVPCKIDVIEFFASWCSPCRDSVARISGFQEKYHDKVTVVAVTRETDHEKLRQFVKDYENQITFRVAIDINQSAKEKLFRPAQRPYIPTAMIIINNLVTYVADPNSEDFCHALASAVEENFPIDL